MKRPPPQCAVSAAVLIPDQTSISKNKENPRCAFAGFSGQAWDKEEALAACHEAIHRLRSATFQKSLLQHLAHRQWQHSRMIAKSLW